MAAPSEDKIRQIVREETSGEFKSIRGEFTGIKGEFKEFRQELHRQGVLLEDLTAKFDKNIDLLTKEMSVKKQVDKHEERIEALETGQETIKLALKRP